MNSLYNSVYPNSSSLYIAGLSNEKLFADKVTFWDSVYGEVVYEFLGGPLRPTYLIHLGFQMSCMKAKVVSECHIVSVGAKDLCTEPIVIKVCHQLVNDQMKLVYTVYLLHFLI